MPSGRKRVLQVHTKSDRRRSHPIRTFETPSRKLLLLAALFLAFSVNMAAALAAAAEAACWRTTIKTSIKKSRCIRGGNYVQLATVDKRGDELLPCVRTVVFRGFLNDDDSEPACLKFVTDARSKKFAQVAKVSDNAEVCWWFSQSSEQFRFTGKLSFIGEDCDDVKMLESRREQWSRMNDNAQEQFFWVGTPGDARTQEGDENAVGA